MSSPTDHAIELHEESGLLEASGDLTSAEAKCREALAIFEAEDGPESPDVANLLFSLGVILEKQLRFDDAGACGRRSLAIIEPLLPLFEDSTGLMIQAHALALLGTVHRQKGEYPAGRVVLERAIAIAEQLSDPNELITALNNLGMLCKFAGWFDRGARSYANAMDIILPITGEEHETVATLYHNIGGLEHARGRYQQAEHPSRRAWEIRRALLGDENLSVQADAVAWAAVLDGLERYKESRPIYEKAIAIYERDLGADHYEVAATLHNLSVVELSEGNPERAMELCRRSLQIKKDLLGMEHPDSALTAMNLGAILLELGEKEEAAPLCAAALVTMKASLAPDHPHIGLAQNLVKATR